MLVFQFNAVKTYFLTPFWREEGQKHLLGLILNSTAVYELQKYEHLHTISI